MENGGPQENDGQKVEPDKPRNNQIPEKPSIRHIMAAITERDAAVLEREIALKERRSALAERDNAILMRDAAFTERDKAVEERDQALQMLESVISSGKGLGSLISNIVSTVNEVGKQAAAADEKQPQASGSPLPDQ